MHTSHININDTISICHYSGISPYKSIVLDVGSDFLVVKLAKDFAVMNFQQGDPVIFGIDNMGDMLIFGCNITKIRTKEDIIEFSIDKLEPGAENRQVERYPVSMCADVRTKNDNKKHLAAIKDMSYYGMLVYSKLDIPPNENIEVDIYMDKSMIFLKAVVNRKTQTPYHFEYGLGIKYEDSSSLNYMKDYIKRLRQEQVEVIRKNKQR